MATVKKKAATKKKVLRSQKAPPTLQRANAQKSKRHRTGTRTNRGGDLEDVASVLMARWEN